MKRLTEIGLLLTAIFFLGSCNSDQQEKYIPPKDPLFVQLDSAQTGIGFINTVEDGPEYNILTYRNFYNGGGVAIGDINNDGLPDLVLTANLGETKLYLNKGNFQFNDITNTSGILSKRGWRTGVTLADVNADGWLDIYICNSGDIKGDNKENELYINQRNNTFLEQAKQFGLNDPGYTTHVSFFDYDLDGDLDCYILNNSFVDVRKFDLEEVRKVRDTLGGHKLMRNDNNHFTDISEMAGIAGTKIAYGLGVSVGDVNNDGYPDIYVSNDFYEKDYLYINQKNGTYKDELPERIAHISSSSMGADIADLNNDGFMDIVTTDMLPEDESRVKTMTRFEQYHIENFKYRYSFHYQYPQNSLQLNNGDGTFTETAFLSGIAATDWSWGALSFDFDNDGFKDIFICNGVVRDISDMDFSDFLANKENVKKVVEGKERFDFRDFFPYIPSTKLPNYAYINQRNLKFINKSQELGLGEPSFSNGVAYGDLDNDGDMDLVVNNINAPSFVYRNDQNVKTKNHFLKISFKGNPSNPFGTGAWVNLYSGQQKQVLQNMPVRSFQSCMDNKIIFGLGSEAKIDSIQITWPGFKRQTIYNPAPDKELIVYERDALEKESFSPKKQTPFADMGFTWMDSFARHTENRYTDFDAEVLIPYMLSTQGPKLAKADVNGDGLEDIYLGGAAGEPGKLMVQTTNGFKLSIQPALAKDKDFEDAGAAFLDIDKDGDQDLLVASGGYQYDQGSSLLLLRLYINEGKGKFSSGKLPTVSTNASCVKVCDINKDGYPDVFVGGRGVAGKYGLAGRSYLLMNSNGTLSDNTPAPLKEPGMVTDAAWSDLDKDGYEDLILVGDWMPVTYYMNAKGTIAEKETVPNSAGLWNCITAADMDNDGDADFLLGNWGLNSQFKASTEKPMELFISDFDDNGTTESAISYYWPDGKSHLYNSKSDITAQLPFLKKKFLRYKDYAGKMPVDVFGADRIKRATIRTIQTLSSSLLLNNGPKQFQLIPLPERLQASAVFSILADDFNRDGKPDMLVSGNFWDIKPDIGRLDANASSLALGDGKGNFSFVNSSESGLDTRGQVRDATIVSVKNKKYIVLARNNDHIKIYQER